ncbi:hypothetical protein DVK07_17905 [Halorubrum sp. Atlit-26R]|nr:hypothetical protein DVK07_17905 [Halorubrum sp. Atlit-26R]
MLGESSTTARASERPEGVRSACEGRGDRSEAEGAARLGRCEAAVAVRSGRESKGRPRGGRRRRKHRSE